MPATSGRLMTKVGGKSGVPAIQSFSTLTIVYCCVVMVIAYAARGASGFGAAAAMPLLGLVLPLKVLVPAWTLIGIAAGAALIGSDRNKVAWGEMIKLVPGTLDRHRRRPLRVHAARFRDAGEMARRPGARLRPLFALGHVRRGAEGASAAARSRRCSAASAAA